MSARSALHFVAAIGNLVCTKLLVEAGADLNLGDKDGARAPLLTACRPAGERECCCTRPCECLRTVTAAHGNRQVLSRMQQRGSALTCLGSSCCMFRCLVGELRR